MRVARSREITIDDIEAMQPERILISPGPGTPDDAGVSMDVIKRFGGRVVRASIPVHGKPARIRHDGRTIFKGLEANFAAGRYHSLIVERATLPACLEISAETDDGIIMGLRHREMKIEGVQFHPESILTTGGKEMLANFLTL